MSYNSKYKGTEVEEILDSVGGKVDKKEILDSVNTKKIELFRDNVSDSWVFRNLEGDILSILNVGQGKGMLIEGVTGKIYYHDDINGNLRFQIFHSGNTKTINGQSLLGEGDIEIESNAGAGFVAQEEEPEDTSLLWVDTDDTTDETDSIIGVDAYMSDTSVNPVQNAVVKQYIDSRMVAVTEAEYEALGDSVNSDGVLYLITE